MTPRCARLAGIALLVLTLSAPSIMARPVDVAAAANMVKVIEPLAVAFAQEHPEIELRFSTAATGNLVAQIRHGAPFALLLSADPDYPQALIDSDDALPATRLHFATGILMLWPRPANGLESLKAPEARRIAIPNPDTAPFGRAARTALSDAGLWEIVQSRLITGENVAQTLHFVQSGNANFAFVAASLFADENERAQGLVLPVDDAALHHTAILLKSAAANVEARTFLNWLSGPTAQSLLARHGYAPVATAGQNPGIDE